MINRYIWNERERERDWIACGKMHHEAFEAKKRSQMAWEMRPSALEWSHCDSQRLSVPILARDGSCVWLGKFMWMKKRNGRSSKRSGWDQNWRVSHHSHEWAQQMEWTLHTHVVCKSSIFSFDSNIHLRSLGFCCLPCKCNHYSFMPIWPQQDTHSQLS